MIADKKTMMPRRATKGSAGYDFYAPEDISLAPGVYVTVDTGVRLEKEIVLGNTIDYENGAWGHNPIQNWFMLLVPRSGLGAKYGVRFRNTVGIIDMDYRDTIKMTLTADVHVTLRRGERIAQGIIVPFGVIQGEIEPTEERHGGHGSTGARGHDTKRSRFGTVSFLRR